MQPLNDPEPHHRLLHNKLKGSSASNYLTTLSVIQGVALADLGSIVVAHYQQFTVEQWLLGVLSFVMLINIWDGYTTLSALWSWIPDLRDAVITLLAGAGLGTYIFFNQRNWRQIVAYARTGRMPTREETQSNEERSP